MRVRAQAITEFALVFPVFMVCVFTFIFLSLWSYNTNAAANVAREAARTGSLQASIASQYFATHPITSLISPGSCGGTWIGGSLSGPDGKAYSSYPGGNAAIAAFRVRNGLRAPGCAAGAETPPGSATARPRYDYSHRVQGAYPYSRLGWDWGILARLPGLGSECGASAKGLHSCTLAPLRAAIERAQALLSQRVIGGSDGALISACYRMTIADGQLSDCIVTITSVDPSPVLSGALLRADWLTSAPAPSAISVSIALPTVGIAFLPAYIERGGATLLLERPTTPCRAPLVAADAFPGSCGGLY